MIDESTRDRLDAVMKRALHDGVNLWDALDKAGLIVTEDQTKKHWAQCLEQLYVNLELMPTVALVQMSPGKQNTPMDAHRGVLEYIDFFRKQFASQAKE